MICRAAEVYSPPSETLPFPENYPSVRLGSSPVHTRSGIERLVFLAAFELIYLLPLPLNLGLILVDLLLLAVLSLFLSLQLITHQGSGTQS